MNLLQDTCNKKILNFHPFPNFFSFQISQIEARIMGLENKVKSGHINEAKKGGNLFFLGHIHLIRNVWINSFQFSGSWKFLLIFLSFFCFSSAFQKAYYPPTALMCPSLINPKSGMENMSEMGLISGKWYPKNYSYFRSWSQIAGTLHCKRCKMRVVLSKWTQDQGHGHHFLSDHSLEKINLIAWPRSFLHSVFFYYSNFHGPPVIRSD